MHVAPEDLNHVAPCQYTGKLLRSPDDSTVLEGVTSAGCRITSPRQSPNRHTRGLSRDWMAPYPSFQRSDRQRRCEEGVSDLPNPANATLLALIGTQVGQETLGADPALQMLRRALL